MRRGSRREAIGQQVVAGVAGLDLDHVALLAEVQHVLDEDKHLAAVLALENLVAFLDLGLRLWLLLGRSGRTG